jgi:hypothetical protein
MAGALGALGRQAAIRLFKGREPVTGFRPFAYVNGDYGAKRAYGAAPESTVPEGSDSRYFWHFGQ